METLTINNDSWEQRSADVFRSLASAQIWKAVCLVVEQNLITF